MNVTYYELTKEPGGWKFIIHQNGKCKHHSEGYPTKRMAKHAAMDILNHLRQIAKIERV